MILAFSTSSAWASVAAVDRKSGVLWTGRLHAPQGAAGACLKLLEAMIGESGLRVEDAELYAADLGPGSFTGVRVGVTLAKTFGYLYGKPVAGASSFDLISTELTVALPSKKREFFIRAPRSTPIRTTELPEGEFVGFGPGIQPETFPDASRFSTLIETLTPADAMTFVPEYLIEPSISIPKKPYLAGVRVDG